MLFNNILIYANININKNITKKCNIHKDEIEKMLQSQTQEYD